MRQAWCALLVIVQCFGLHHRTDDFRKDGFKQHKFGEGYSTRLRIEPNLDR
jgi:hypothetical protein